MSGATLAPRNRSLLPDSRSHPVSLVVALLVSLIWIGHRAVRPDIALTIDRMEFIPGEHSSAGFESPDWKAVTLPDDWHFHDDRQTEGWYRYHFDLQVPPNRLWAVYLPSIRDNAAVFLNSELLGDGGSFADPVARNGNRPFYFSIPNGLLRPGANTLSIRLKAEPAFNGLLSELFLGPDEFIAPYYEFRYLMRYTTAQFILLALVLTAVLMLMLWWHRPSDTVYAWYALGLLVFAAHNLKLVIIEIPFDAHTWDLMIWITMLWFPVIATSFIQRFHR